MRDHGRPDASRRLHQKTERNAQHKRIDKHKEIQMDQTEKQRTEPDGDEDPMLAIPLIKHASKDDLLRDGRHHGRHDQRHEQTAACHGLRGRFQNGCIQKKGGDHGNKHHRRTQQTYKKNGPEHIFHRDGPKSQILRHAQMIAHAIDKRNQENDHLRQDRKCIRIIDQHRKKECYQIDPQQVGYDGRRKYAV